MTKYYAQGNGIYQQPNGGTMGFLIGRVEEHVTSDSDMSPAEEIADALNKAEATQWVEKHKLDQVYEERNRLVALLARIYPSGIARTEIEGWDPEWHQCVYIDTPMGQMSWHYHDRDAWMFAGLDYYAGQWDGHTTGEKYNRMRQLVDTLDRQKLLGVSAMDRAGLAGLAAVEASTCLPEVQFKDWLKEREGEKALPTTYTDWLAGTDDASSSSDT